MGRQSLVVGTHGEIRRTVNKAGTPTAVTRYRRWDGKTVKLTRTGRTPAEAERNLKTLIAEMSRTEDTSMADTKISVVLEEWWDEYLATKNPPIGTERRYRSVIDNHVIPGLGSFTIREARTPRVNAFLRALTESTSPATASIAKAIVRNLMGYAIRMGAITVNPVDGCAPIQSKTAPPKAWTLEQISTLRHKLREWDNGTDRRGMRRVSDLAGPSDFMLGTGCRPGETFAVKWEDIDFTSSPPTVRIHSTVVKDKNFKTSIQPHTKTNRVRVLALPPFLVAQLLERRTHSFTELVFPSSTGTVRSPDNFRIQWKTALGEGAAMFDELPKTFRSSVATFIAAEGGVDAARGQLGHSTVTTTEKRYVARADIAADMSGTLERLFESGY